MTGTWRGMPLRSQLTIVFTALLVVGLVLSGVIALGLLRRSLVGQLDAQLAAATPGLVEEYLRSGGPRDRDDDDDRDLLPSDYQVVFSSTSGDVVSRYPLGSAPRDTAAVPVLTSAEVVALGGSAFTVGSQEGPARWRVVVQPLVTERGSTVVGSVAVALPMAPAEATLRQMRVALLVVAAAVVALGVVAGRWGVRTALRPLRDIEDTAAAIADGDLSRRVPQAPPSTEVGRLSAALNGMLAQIERAFAARTASEERMRRFVADASHELRTPLATIRGYGELYRMGALTTEEEVAGSLRRIEDSAARMGSLVDDLLALARLDEGRPQRADDVDLAVLAGDAAADLRALDPTRPVRLEPLSGAGAGGAVTRGDEQRLRQVVANLVGNVVQHTPPGTAVEIAVGRETGPDGRPLAVVEVRDHGPGIPPEHLTRVFERFYRVDAARGRSSGGAGLGMAIVQAIVDAHGGSVELRPTPGGGLTARVALPGA